jgi:hypothetical protein
MPGLFPGMLPKKWGCEFHKSIPKSTEKKVLCKMLFIIKNPVNCCYANQKRVAEYPQPFLLNRIY